MGGEYAGQGWSLGLRYNASFFHNNVSNLTWDNPTNLSGTGAACTDGSGFSTTSTGPDANRGPCRGRLDLYPSNQAHTWTLTGAAKLPFKSNFMGTVSYGVRLQNDAFLPFTTNTALAARRVSRESLDGDVRPLMVNATAVNRFFDPLDLKAYYRLYDFDNRSKIVDFPDGRVIDDSGTNTSSVRSFPWAYSKQNIGLDASYNITRWLSAKMGYVWEKMHRERREVLDSNEHTFGPTVDIKPTSWLLGKLSYKRSLRDAHNYDAGRTWRSCGRDQTNTVSFGSDLKLIENLLGLRIQYSFSEGSSLVKNSGNSAGTTPTTNLPIINSRWHEFLTRFDYQLHKNATLRFGYYYNRYNQRDYGVDIMKPWMGDVDTSAGQQRSIYLGDRIKRPYNAHVGLLGLRLTF